MKSQELIERSEKLFKDIEEYIKSVPDWIYYWIPPTVQSDSKNYPLKEYVLNYQDDWMDDIKLTVVDFNGVSVKVHIYLPPEEESPVFERYLILNHFERDVEYNKKAMNGQLNDIKIKELTEEIAYHKEQLKCAEEELNKLIEDKNREV